MIQWIKEQGQRSRRLDLFLAGLAFAISLTVYTRTLSPGLSYASPDGNELITVCATLGLAHATGYPLYTWLGKLFSLLPIGSVAYRVNLMSAVLGAGGVALLYGIVRLLPLDSPRRTHRWAAFATALLFAFSPTFWSQTTIAEVYAVNLFFVTLTLSLFLLWARKRARGARGQDGLLLAACLALGLSIGTHMSNLGFLPAYGLFVLMIDPRIWRRPLLIVGGLGAFALGCAQFLWLPYKAHTLNDALMLRDAPTTWQGVYAYTLGAFPQFKFAFSLPEIPERIVLYLELLRQNVGIGGILMGLYGLTELLRRRTARFYLLIGLYLVHVVFFVQYRVFDLDVFFIPAHFVYLIAIGYGLAAILGHLQAVVARSPQRWLRPAVQIGCALLLLGAVGWQLGSNYGRSDRSGDTAVEDFYEAAFQLLPQNSVLLGQSGVFGYDMFYYRLVEDVRPDLSMPLLDTPRVRPKELHGRTLYTTLRASAGGRAGPGGFNAPVLPDEAWYIPLLVGENAASSGGLSQRDLVLYRVSLDPPALVQEQVQPQFPVGAALDGLYLEGYDLNSNTVTAGEPLQLTLYWRLIGRPKGLVVVGLGETDLETHPLGFGNLERYLQQFGPPGDALIVEDYALVVPSDTPPGSWPLRVGVMGYAPAKGTAPSGDRGVEVDPIGTIGTIGTIGPIGPIGPIGTIQVEE